MPQAGFCRPRLHVRLLLSPFPSSPVWLPEPETRPWKGLASAAHAGSASCLSQVPGELSPPVPPRPAAAHQLSETREGNPRSEPLNPQPTGAGQVGAAHLARKEGSPGRCQGSRPLSPSRNSTARSCPARGPEAERPAWCGGWGQSPRPGDTQGQGHTHNPHAIKGHLGVELSHHVLPPVKGLGIGEVRESGESRPHLDKRPDGRWGPWSLPEAQASRPPQAADPLVSLGLDGPWREERGESAHFQTRPQNPPS